MPHLMLTADDPYGWIRLEIITVSEIDQIYRPSCTGDGSDECPDSDDLRETWADFTEMLLWAYEHIEKHEARLRAGRA